MLRFSAAVNRHHVRHEIATVHVVIQRLGPRTLVLFPRVSFGRRNAALQPDRCRRGRSTHWRGPDEFHVIRNDGRVGAEDALEGALDAEFADERPGIDAGNAGDAVAGKVGIQRFDRAEVGSDGGEFLDDEAFNL